MPPTIWNLLRHKRLWTSVVAGCGLLVSLRAVCAETRLVPYLPPGAVPDASHFLSRPPPPGSSASARDAALFRLTRALAGTPRWNQAAHDADLAPARLAADFSCAAGRTLDRNAAIVSLLGRVEADAEAVVAPAKRHFAVVRPQAGNTLPICVPRTTALDESPAYPSGHATIGWASALILAELLPGHADTLLDRGRTFGESRIVCGVHWASDVEAGRIVGAALVAALHADAAFRADLEAARTTMAEPDVLDAPDAGDCLAEGAALAASVDGPLPGDPLVRSQPGR